MMRGELRIFPVIGIGEVYAGDDLVTHLLDALEHTGQCLQTQDVVVVTQKIVSKAEGRVIRLAEVDNVSVFAQTVAATTGKDARMIEVVLRESRRIVRMDRGVLITETHHGFICANAGVDTSNVAGEDVVTLLPVDADASARVLREALAARANVDVAVVIADSFGRPWREGQVNIAVGVAGFDPLREYVGERDPYGMTLETSALAVGDELASAAELVMGKVDQIPMAIVRGFVPHRGQPTTGGVQRLLRDPSRDMFR